MARKLSAVDEIVASLPQARRMSWEYRVEEQHHETLAEIKAAARDGRFGKSKIGAAKAISDYLIRHGISQIGQQGVLAWLAKP